MTRPFRRHLLAILAISGLALLVGGCSAWGGRVLESSHVAFNTSVAQAIDRQMLLNLVRLSFDLPTQWMSVASINVNTRVDATASGLGFFGSGAGDRGSSGGSVSFGYTPNITFVPRQGELLGQELMSPIPVQSVESMVSAGWPLSWMLFLTCERCQDVRSFDVTKQFGVVPLDARFGKLLLLADNLESRQLLSVSRTPVPVTWNQRPILVTNIELRELVLAKQDHAQLRPRPDGTYDYITLE